MGPDRLGAYRRDLPAERARIGSSFGSAANWLGNFIVSQFFLVLLDAFGNNVGGPFAIFGVFSALSIPFVMRLVPETNGKSLEEIEEEMTKR